MKGFGVVDELIGFLVVDTLVWLLGVDMLVGFLVVGVIIGFLVVGVIIGFLVVDVVVGFLVDCVVDREACSDDEDVAVAEMLQGGVTDSWLQMRKPGSKRVPAGHWYL